MKKKAHISILLVTAMLMSVMSVFAVTASADTYNDFTYNLVNNAIEITAYKGSGTIVKFPAKINGFPVKTLSNGVFQSNQYIDEIEDVFIPDTITTVSAQTFSECSNMKYVNVDAASAFFASDFDGVLYNKTKTTVVYCPPKLTEVDLPDTVATIASHAFEYCVNLKSLTLPPLVSALGTYAFNGCTNIKTIVIPDGVTSITSYAFSDCTSLESVTLPEKLISIGAYAFHSCAKLAAVSFPNNLSDISYFAFFGCNALTAVDIPASVATVGTCAFANCDALNSVIIRGLTTSLGTYFVGYSMLTSLISGVKNGKLVITGHAKSTAADYAKNTFTFASLCAEFEEKSEPVPPTCAESGYTVYTCTVCGGERMAEFTFPIPHTAGDWVIDKEATYYEEGKQHHVCTVCSNSFDDTAIPRKPLPYTDVAHVWYYDPICYVCSKGLFNGTSDTSFQPMMTMTRGMLATVLYRQEGEPFTMYKIKFDDVKYGNYYAVPVTWASDKSIVKGTSVSTFSPNDNITRQDLAVILYRYASYKNYDISASAALSGFSDYKHISSYATSAISWAVGTGLIQGSGGNLSPTNTASRAEVATILMRFNQNIVEK